MIHNVIDHNHGSLREVVEQNAELYAYIYGLLKERYIGTPWMQQRTFWILVLQRQHSRSTVMMSVSIPAKIDVNKIRACAQCIGMNPTNK